MSLLYQNLQDLSLQGFPVSSAGKRIHPSLIPGPGSSLEKRQATHSSILAWRIPWTVQSKESDKTKRLSVQFSSVTQSCPTLCSPMDSGSLAFPVLHHLLELAHTHVHQVRDAIQTLLLCQPLLLLPSIFPSIRVFSNELALCIRWPKYWNFGFSISPSSENLGLIFFRIDWLALLAVQGTLKKTFRKHQFFGGQPSLWSIHDYWKNHSFDQTDLCQQSDVSAF